jgi:NitT/TauT family transport system substrate-binding protein
MMKRSAFLAATAAAAAAAPAGAQSLVPLKLSINPKFITNAPIFVAVDKGYFKAQGIDLQIIDLSASATGQVPLLARGDIDMSTVGPVPSLFNQIQQGFNVKLVASTQQSAPPKSAYIDSSTIVVRKDVWDSHAIRKLSDLAGKRLDAATPGSPTHVLGLEALAAAKLRPADLTFTTKDTGPPNQLAAILNKAVDAQITTEPTATAMQTQGLAVKWIGYKDVAPWYQTSYFAVSDQYLQGHRDAIVRFLTAYLHGCADVERSHGKLTPPMVAELSRWTEISESVIDAMGGLPYFGQYGTIDLTALRRVQALWVDQKFVTAPIDVERIVDAAPLRAARAAAGIR